MRKTGEKKTLYGNCKKLGPWQLQVDLGPLWPRPPLTILRMVLCVEPHSLGHSLIYINGTEKMRHRTIWFHPSTSKINPNVRLSALADKLPGVNLLRKVRD